MPYFDHKSLDIIKKLTVISLVSDDILMDRLVLKGGNAINLIYSKFTRASRDIDYSMAGDFDEDEIDKIQDKIEIALKTTFSENGYHVHDIVFEPRPENLNPNIKEFWGGYIVKFKVIPTEEYKKYTGDTTRLRNNSIVIDESNSSNVFTVDISKHEFIERKTSLDFEGYNLYAYTPEMIAFEKLRAICQQLPEYREIVYSMTPTSRARDFFDLYVLTEHFNIDFTTKENLLLLKNIFEAKKVPWSYLKLIQHSYEFHESSFQQVRDTVEEGYQLKSFDYYFNFVLDIVSKLAEKA